MREVSVGENLDQYKLIEVIARSGMASIFKAIDQIDGKTVAIKVPYMQFESDVIFYGRFQREEDVGRRLIHPGIFKVLTPRKKSRMYIAMEYIEGESLRAMMRGTDGMPVEKALGLARHQMRQRALSTSGVPDDRDRHARRDPHVDIFECRTIAIVNAHVMKLDLSAQGRWNCARLFGRSDFRMFFEQTPYPSQRRSSALHQIRHPSHRD